jgi:hypothetical protein
MKMSVTAAHRIPMEIRPEPAGFPGQQSRVASDGLAGLYFTFTDDAFFSDVKNANSLSPLRFAV